MAPSTSFIVLVTALLINTLSYGFAENVYCVTPTATSRSSYPHNLTHCAMLFEYAQDAELFFTSDTTMVFLPGDHVLDRTITVANVTRLTMRGQSSSGSIATVVRNGSVGFSFTNMVDFNIYSLTFTSYHRSWSYDSHPASNSALLLQSTKNARLVNCSFHNNLGTALTVHNTSITLEENKFTHNQCGCELFNERCKLGCGITALNSTLTFTGNTTFCKNNHNNFEASKVGAGAILAAASSLNFTGTSNFFDNVNSANNAGGHVVGSGGAICILNNAVFTFHGINNFINNSAENGAAIYAELNILIGATDFSNDSAQSGVAIYTANNAVLIFNGTNNFINNIAGSDGGVFYTADNVVLIFSGTNNFINNIAGSDGGVFYTVSNTVLTITGTNNFINNSAEVCGGAIFTSHNTVLTITGTNNFLDNYTNGRNIKINGWTIYTWATGGVIYTTNNVLLTFTGTNNFIGNTANSGGGSFYAASNISLTFIGTTDFTNNSANVDGGAISAKTNILLTFKGISNFSNNAAEVGGVLSTLDYVVLIFTGTINFIDNSAMQGGAISADQNSTLTFDGSISFNNNGNNSNKLDINYANYENSHGGALYLALNSTLSILPHTTVYWENNHAGLGGAIYVDDVNPLIYCTQIIRYIPREECFFQLPGRNLSRGIDVQLVFKNNSADDAGSVLYGGAIDNCKLTWPGLDGLT